MEDIRHENTSLKEYIDSLERQLASRSAQPEPTLISPPAPQPIDLPNATATIQAPAEMPIPSLGASEGDRDDLKIIKGIGPAIERKLNNSGIYTFAALAALGKKDLENILGSQVNRLQDENDLLAQAKKLARRR
jgi:predicted flap endonuclease-1-like 5' DNA nuclease